MRSKPLAWGDPASLFVKFPLARAGDSARSLTTSRRLFRHDKCVKSEVPMFGAKTAIVLLVLTFVLITGAG